jgi:excisionase family DNA binding protein
MKLSTPECEDGEIPVSGLARSMSKKVDRRFKTSGATYALPEEKFFTIGEVAGSFNVCDRTVRRWIDRKKLVAHDFEGIIRISESDLRAFAAQHRRS